MPPAAPPTSPPRTSRQVLRGAILLALTGLLLTFAFPIFNLWFLAPLALVPWVVCLIRRPMNLPWLAASYAFAFLWFLLNFHWLHDVTVAGLIPLALYLAVYWAAFAWGTRRLIVQLRVPALFAVPLVWVTTEFLRATVLTGMPWFLLGNALAPKLVFIQIADLLGVWGVSFFAAMTAGWLVDVLRLPLRRHGRFAPAIARLTVIYVTVTALVVGYGLFRLNQNTARPGPRVAVIQDSLPQEQKDTRDDAAKLQNFQHMLTLSREAIDAANKDGHPLDLIAWPETMVPAYLNPEWLHIDSQLQQWGLEVPAWVREDLSTSRAYDAQLRDLADTSHAYVLVGAPSLAARYNPRAQPGRQVVTDRANLAILYAPGLGQVNLYAKRHLVPFGEFVFFHDSWPWMYRQLMRCTPYGPDGDYTLTPGPAWTRLEITVPAGNPSGETFRFGVPICYEDVMPEPSRGFAEPTNGRKGCDFLLSISNDGWYMSRFELDQHLQMDQLRAVENRVPIARAVNTGDSGFVDSDGRLGALVTAPDADGRPTPYFVAGWAAEILPLDSRVSLYSRIGDLFPIICGIITALAVAWTIVRPRRA